MRSFDALEVDPAAAGGGPISLELPAADAVDLGFGAFAFSALSLLFFAMASNPLTILRSSGACPRKRVAISNRNGCGCVHDGHPSPECTAWASTGRRPHTLSVRLAIRAHSPGVRGHQVGLLQVPLGGRGHQLNVPKGGAPMHKKRSPIQPGAPALRLEVFRPGRLLGVKPSRGAGAGGAG